MIKSAKPHKTQDNTDRGHTFWDVLYNAQKYISIAAWLVLIDLFYVIKCQNVL